MRLVVPTRYCAATKLPAKKIGRNILLGDYTKGNAAVVAVALKFSQPLYVWVRALKVERIEDRPLGRTILEVYSDIAPALVAAGIRGRVVEVAR